MNDQSAMYVPTTSGVGLTEDDLPALPDAIAQDRRAGWLDPRGWFEEPARPFELEIGSGKGTFLVQESPTREGTNFLGIEYAREFWAHAVDRVERNGLRHVRLLYADAKAFLEWRMPSGIVEVLHLYFPDPWPKRRHHNRRMVSDVFLREAWRVLVNGGEIRIVTDHDDYWAWMETHFARWCEGEGVEGIKYEREAFSPPESAEDGEFVGTNFERKYQKEGRGFNATVLRKPDLIAP